MVVGKVFGEINCDDSFVTLLLVLFFFKRNQNQKVQNLLFALSIDSVVDAN